MNNVPENEIEIAFNAAEWQKNQNLASPTYKIRRHGMIWLTIILLIILAVTGAGLYIVAFRPDLMNEILNKPPALPIVTPETVVPTSPAPAVVTPVASSTRRIVYQKADKLFSTTLDGENTIDLSNLLAGQYKRGSIIVTKDGKRFCFSSDYNIFCGNTDGTQTKKITNNTPPKYNFGVRFIGVNEYGTRLLFSYEPPEMGAGTETPGTEYGIYYYSEGEPGVKFLAKSFYFGKDESFGSYDFVKFIDDKAIFTNSRDWRLYTLNPGKNEFVVFSDVALPYFSIGGFIEPKKGLIVYQAGGESNTPYSSSQILSLNYTNGTKSEISPLGKWAEYQYLSVSPEFTNVVYGHQTYKENQIDRIDFYVYNIASKETRPLNLKDPSHVVTWLDENTFFYVTREPYPGLRSVYKVDLTNNKISSFLENLDEVFFR